MKRTRPVLVSIAALSLLALSACGSSEDAASPPPETPAVDAPEDPSDGGGVVDSGEGEAASVEGEGGASSGSPLGDANREEFLMMGYTEEDLEGVEWAGDVSTEEGSFIEYPDGLRVDFAGVEPGSAPVSEEQGDLDSEKSLVRVSLTVSNTGADALPIDGDWTPFRVFEGENLTEVSSHVGYFGEEDDLYSADDASVVAPGSEVEVYQSFEVDPGSVLEVELNMDFFGVEHTPFVFYGVTAP